MTHPTAALLARVVAIALTAPALCARAAAQDDAPDLASELAARVDALERDSAERYALVARYEDVTVTFQLFGDVGVEFSDPAPADRANTSFTFGTLDAFVSAQMGDDFQVLSETVLTGSDHDSSFAQERLWGAWTFSDLLYAKLGLEHSPITLWNRRYHHGAWLEPTIARPLLAGYEGSSDGFLPLHNEGLELGGSVLAGPGQIDYTLIVSNGRGATPEDKQKNSDANDPKAVAVALAWSPASGLYSAGVAVHVDDIAADPSSPTPALTEEVDELVGTAFVESTLGPLELLAELALLTHETTLDGRDYEHTAGYLQALLPLGDWTPYLRFDVKSMEEGDPYLALSDKDLDQWRQTVGVRHDFASHAAFKVELGFGQRDVRGPGPAISQDDFVSAAFQLSFAI